MDVLLSLAVGLGLAAACGFRVFVPLLAASIAAHGGHLELASGFDWIGSTAAVVAFGTATLLEVGAYYIPWLDHALDAVTTPAAVLAGMFASASVIVDMPPLLKWSVVLVGGGGIAGLTQGATVALRAKSGLFTGGLANPGVSTLELVSSAGTAILAIVVPVVALVLVIVMVVVSVRLVRRFMARRRAAET
jgi:hypothetical protein